MPYYSTKEQGSGFACQMWPIELNFEGRGRQASTHMSKIMKKGNVSVSLEGYKSFNMMEDKERQCEFQETGILRALFVTLLSTPRTLCGT